MNMSVALEYPTCEQQPDYQQELQQPQSREILHRRLVRYGGNRVNDELFARLLASYWAGEGGLPRDLGLGAEGVAELINSRFPGVVLPVYHPSHTQLDPDRQPERDELIALMLMHRAGDDEGEAAMAHIVAAACMANDHLWQDLGLWSRSDLGQLMQHNFPALAAKNDRDMKWKKFLYKQLCVQEGIYTCRSPSCEVCADYAACFGPEE